MRRRGQVTTLQERIEISDRAVAGETDPEMARAMGCSVYTARKWRRRFVKHGRAGLRSTVGRPSKGPLGSFSAKLRQTLRQWRESHPGWGADTLLIELKRDPFWGRQTLPSRTQIAAFLKAADLTRGDQRAMHFVCGVINHHYPVG